jgi:hypothetical protein
MPSVCHAEGVLFPLLFLHCRLCILTCELGKKIQTLMIENKTLDLCFDFVFSSEHVINRSKVVGSGVEVLDATLWCVV